MSELIKEAVNLTEYCKSFESIDKLIDSQEGYESYVKLCSLLCFGSIVKEYMIICEKNSSKYYSGKNGLKILLNLLNEKTFIQDLIDLDSKYVRLIVFNINWFSKLADENKHIWEELNASEILTNYIKSYEFAQINALMALSNVANDKDLENISEFDMAIKILADFSIQCAFKSNLTSQEEFKYGDDVYKFEMKNKVVEKIRFLGVVSFEAR
ncbi:unnamed protein product [Brachionus calyciflorus]|uniref:Uncharacterized protein n=1 Tax=Brachionus calyciflorus TaxID=104777 RepID=A0A813PQF5_9BILA|nr:unnamed protein product [Brachionus calyciflorus]